MITAFERSIPVELPYGNMPCDILCGTEIPGGVRVLTVFNGTDGDGTPTYETLVYVDDVYEAVGTSFSPAEATTFHIDVVSMTGGRYYAV